MMNQVEFGVVGGSMRKSLLAMMFGCGVSGMVMADSGISTALQLGYRADSLDWNIASDLTGQATPNIVSELQWTNLQIPLVSWDIDVYLADFYLRGNVAYGEIDSGNNQDSDYYGDNRTVEFSRSNNNAAGGEVADASIGFGYKFDTSDTSSKFRSYFMPMLGYSLHTQDMKMTDAVQTVESNVTPPLGPFPDLNSTYDAEWEGVWVGLIFGEQNTKTDMEIELSLIYHDVDYQAEADWNLRTDFAHPKSYEHMATGHGLSFSLDGRTPFRHSKRWFWAFGLDYGRWQTKAGLTTFYVSDGSTPQQQLNEVNWESSAINLGLELRM